MFETPLNQRTITLKLKRREVCDLLMVCTVLSANLKGQDDAGTKWDMLHDKIKAVLEDFDAKHSE